MALKDFRLDSLSRPTQMLIFLALVALLVAVFYFFYLRGALEEQEALTRDVTQLEISVAQGTAIASQLERFKKELVQLEERLSVLRSILPAAKETPSVLKSVQQMAASSNLKIIKFRPQAVVPRAFYSDWPIQLEIQGCYDALGLFFERIGQSTRLINVENMSIKGIEGSKDSARTLNATCTATTFVFREEAVAPAAGN